MKRTITVSQEHIDRGEPRNSNQCPIALAVMANFPYARDVYVGKFAIEATLGADAVYWPLSGYAVEFLDKFDDCQDVHPFTLELE